MTKKDRREKIEDIYNKIDKAKAAIGDLEDELAELIPDSEEFDCSNLGYAVEQIDDFLGELQDYMDDIEQ